MKNNNLEEIWKDIPDYEGLYQASDIGRVKSLGRVVNCNGGTRLVKERILSPQSNEKGYQRIALSKNGETKCFFVHRVIWITFNGEIQQGFQINHNDENHQNNSIDNLSLMTPKENSNFGTRTERVAKAQKNDPKRSKPVVGMDEQGNVIVEFQSTMDAQRHGYSSSNISSCCRGTRPKHKGLIWKYKDGTA